MLIHLAIRSSYTRSGYLAAKQINIPYTLKLLGIYFPINMAQTYLRKYFAKGFLNAPSVQQSDMLILTSEIEIEREKGTSDLLVKCCF